MLKGLVKTTLAKRRVTKYNRLVSVKSSAYDKWQKQLEKQPVMVAEAPVNYETLPSGEILRLRLFLMPKSGKSQIPKVMRELYTFL